MVKLSYEQCEQLFNLNALLTQSLEKKTVLQNLLQAAMNLIQRADTVIIYEWDEAAEYLVYSDGIGVELAPIQKVKFRAGESIAGRAFQEQKIYNVSQPAAKSYMQDMSPKNQEAFQQAVNYKEVESILAVPLVAQDHCIGVLVVDNFDIPDEVFTEEETLIMKIVANQAAIALTNSRMYKQLKKRNNDLLTIQKVHHTFSNILLEGKGMVQITDVLSRMISGKVTYEESVEIREDETVYPIISSNETLGFFRLPKKYDAYSNVEKVAIEQAANAIVIELMKQNNLFEQENKLQEELFQKLLDGTWDDSLTLHPKFNRLSTFRSGTCLLIEGKDGPLWPQLSLVAKERKLKKLERAFQTMNQNVILFNRVFTIVVILCDSKPIQTKKLHTLLEKVFPENNVNVGIGRQVPIRQIGNSYQEANDALQLAKKSKNHSIILYEDLGFERLWHHTDEETLLQYVADHLGPLLNGDPFDLETIKTYLQLNGKHKETAKKLNIHPNTLTYRLKKIENLLSIDLRNRKDLLTLMTAFNILDYLPTSSFGMNNK